MENNIKSSDGKDVNGNELKKETVNIDSKTKTGDKKKEKTNEKKKKFKLKIGKTTKKFIFGIVSIALLCFVGYMIFSLSPLSKTSASARLLSVLDSEEIINELNVLSIPYNGVFTKKENQNDENSKILYHIAFKGSVKLGIDVDMKKMLKNIDEEKFEIHFVIPEIKINDCPVRSDSLDFIYVDKSYDTELSVFERKKECEDYLYDIFNNDEQKKELARENVKSFIKSFFESIVAGVDRRYKVVIDDEV